MRDISDREAERLEISKIEALRVDMLYLLNDEAFKRVILGDYIDNTAKVIGSSFVGSDDDIGTLKAISHLKRYIESIALY